jgi:hypothetical protein
MSFRFGIFENPNITSPPPSPNSLFPSFSPNGHLASHINPFCFSWPPLDQKTEENEDEDEDEESGRRRGFGVERKREIERGRRGRNLEVER